MHAETLKQLGRRRRRWWRKFRKSWTVFGTLQGRSSLYPRCTCKLRKVKK